MNWQPMSTAPLDGTVILGILPDSDVPHSIFYGNFGRTRNLDPTTAGWRIAWDHFKLSEMDQPRAWMPLPESPQ